MGSALELADEVGLVDPLAGALGEPVGVRPLAKSLGLGAIVGAWVEGGAPGTAVRPPPALTINVVMTINATTAAAMTSTRRTQYVWDGSGPTGCNTLVMGSSLGSKTDGTRQARRTRRRSDRYGSRMERAPEPAIAPVVRRILQWYDASARDLPWRRPEATPWQVMVSEFMLQQTPVARVLGPWRIWLERWPNPAALAAAPAGEAVRAWGRLGYPRRALRLHQSAVVITEQHGGQVPDDHDALLRLPGVGAYTAAAIASFAFGQRRLVLDTNVRRVLARIGTGVAFPAASPTVAEQAMAAAFVPRGASRATRWAVASMELGALVCTARAPRCGVCPVVHWCAWRRAGYPAWEGPPRRGQPYAGTDRQCRGALLAVVRSSDQPVAEAELSAAWTDDRQRRRALASLIADGLLTTLEKSYTLPR